MIFRIIRGEWRTLLAERSFLLLALVFGGLALYGLFSAEAWFRERRSEGTATIEKQTKDFADRAAKLRQGSTDVPAPSGQSTPSPGDPYDIGMNLHYAVLPFDAAAILSVGQADILPNKAGITISTLQRTEADKDGFENPLQFLSGKLDLAFVVVYLFPLFILAVSFNVLSGERENGTLQLVLSNPLSVRSFLIAKITAQYLLVSSLLVMVTASGLVITTGGGTGSLWMRFIVWVLVVLVYAAFWFGLAALINSFGLSSATNAVVAAATWLILVLVLPTLLNIVLTAAYPVPPRSEVVAAIRGVNLDMRRDGEKLLTEFYQDHPELIPKDGKLNTKDFGLAFVYVQREQKKRIQAVESRFDAQLQNQQALVRQLRFLSPAIIVQESLNDLAGTGSERFAQFRAQSKQFDRDWDEFFTTRIFRGERLTADEIENIPAFLFAEEPFSSLFRRIAIGLAGLFAATIAFALISSRRLTASAGLVK